MPKERTPAQHDRDQNDVLRYRGKIKKAYDDGNISKLQGLKEHWEKQDSSFARGNLNLIELFLELLGKK